MGDLLHQQIIVNLSSVQFSETRRILNLKLPQIMSEVPGRALPEGGACLSSTGCCELQSYVYMPYNLAHTHTHRYIHRERARERESAKFQYTIQTVRATQMRSILNPINSHTQSASFVRPGSLSSLAWASLEPMPFGIVASVDASRTFVCSLG